MMIRTILWIIDTAYLLAIGSAFLVVSTETWADEDGAADIQQRIVEKARISDSGVILAVGHKGHQAAETAYLLSVQHSNNQNYAPLLIIADDQSLQKELAALNLAKNQLPSLIFYSAEAKEIVRLVSTNNPPSAAFSNNISSLVVKQKP
jgi:hypothetical protein